MKLYWLSVGTIAIAASSIWGIEVRADQNQVCAGDGMIAKMIATHRHNGGYTVTEMMSKLGSEPGLKRIIIDAYDQPLMLTAETRKIAIEEFSNKWVVNCYKNGPAVPRKE